MALAKFDVATMATIARRYSGLVSFLLGAFAATGFAPLAWWPIALACFAAWMWLIHDAPTLRQVLRRGGNAGSILRSNLFKIDVRRDPQTRRAIEVVASGAGSGHGVGLCQTGALGMARAGRSSEQILRHYYPGIELKRLY